MAPAEERDSLPPLERPEDLVQEGQGAGDTTTGPMRTALANALVGLMKQYYGRGPTGAKAYLLDDLALVVLEDGLTRSEETLLAAGKPDLVRQYRLAFQEAVTETITGAVAEIVGRNVRTYHSQIVFDPVRSFELFVLDPEG